MPLILFLIGCAILLWLWQNITLFLIGHQDNVFAFLIGGFLSGIVAKKRLNRSFFNWFVLGGCSMALSIILLSCLPSKNDNGTTPDNHSATGPDNRNKGLDLNNIGHI